MGLAGTAEQGRGMGWTLQEPVSSDIDRRGDSRRCRGWERGRACAERSAAWERTRREKSERGRESISGAVVGIEKS